jgi:outer membrane protein
MEYTQKVLKEVEEVVRSLGEREKYSLILEKSQAGILYATPTIDITSKVITLFNQAAKNKPIK